jgi:hypothetical protein
MYKRPFAERHQRDVRHDQLMDVVDTVLKGIPPTPMAVWTQEESDRYHRAIREAEAALADVWANEGVTPADIVGALRTLRRAGLMSSATCPDVFIGLCLYIVDMDMDGDGTYTYPSLA